jgi:peroxiredoxin
MEPWNLTSDRLLAETRRAEKEAPEFSQAYERLVQRLIAANAGSTAPKVGDLFPEFVLPDDEGRLTTFDEMSAGAPLVVSLNRGHWCSYCRIELEGLQALQPEIARRGARVIAITPDRQAYARKLKVRCGLTFPLFSDVGNGFAMALGLVVWVGDEVRTLYQRADVNLNEYQGDEGWLIPIPATYVVAPDRRIKAAFVDPDFRKRMPPGDILGAIASQ